MHTQTLSTIKKTGKSQKKFDAFCLKTKVLSKVCTPWMLALKGTGNIHTSHLHSLSTRFLRPSHVSPWPTVDRNESEPGGRGTKRTSDGEQKHGLMSLIYYLS